MRPEPRLRLSFGQILLCFLCLSFGLAARAHAVHPTFEVATVRPVPADADAKSTLPPLDVALKDATGLVLKGQKVPVEMVVIELAEKVPTAN